MSIFFQTTCNMTFLCLSGDRDALFGWRYPAEPSGSFTTKMNLLQLQNGREYFPKMFGFLPIIQEQK